MGCLDVDVLGWQVTDAIGCRKQSVVEQSIDVSFEMDEWWMQGGEADAQGSHGSQGGTGWEVGFGLALGLWHECMR